MYDAEALALAALESMLRVSCTTSADAQAVAARIQATEPPTRVTTRGAHA